MGPTDPRVLIHLLHDLGDRVRRAVREGRELARDARWLQSQTGEWAANVGHAARNGAEAAERDRKRASHAATAAGQVVQEQAAAEEEIRGAAGLVAAVQQRAATAVAYWGDQVRSAEQAVHYARAELADAESRLAECQQPVYVRGPNGQVVARYRDCSAHRRAVAIAERELDRAVALLEHCLDVLERARWAEQRVTDAQEPLAVAHTEVEGAAASAQRAVRCADQAVRVARDEVALGEEAVRQATATTNAVQAAGRHAHRAENEFQRGETAARNAETDLGKRIESLEAFNRPRPLPG
jgi:hypothetical protein